MANKKIQIKNNSGDSLFPVTKRTCVDDFDHTHSFTGTAATISMTGSYSTVGSITIAPVTPAGTVTLSRTAGVALTTSTISQITGVGTLPTSEKKTVVTSAVGSVKGTFVGGKGTVTTESVTSGAPATYTPGGSITQPTFTGSITLTTSTTSTAGDIKYIEDISQGAISTTKGDYTPAGSVASSFTGNPLTLSSSYTPSGTVTSSFTGASSSFSGSYTPSGTVALTGGSPASLTTSTTNSGSDIGYLEEATYNAPSLTTTTISQITGVGSLPSLSANTTSTGGIKYVSQIGSTLSAPTASGYVKGISGGSGSFTATVSSGHILVLAHTHTAASVTSTGSAVTSVTHTISPTTSYMHFSAGSLPTKAAVTVGTALSAGSLTKTKKYMKFNAGALRSGATFTGSPGTVTVTGTPKGSVGSTFTGKAATISVTGTPTGSVTSTFTGTKTNTLVTAVSGGNISKTTKYLDAAVSGSVTKPTFTGTAVRLVTSPTGSVSITTTTAPTTTISSITTVGTLPTKAAITVATGVSTQPTFSGTFSGTSVTPTASISSSNKAITLSTSYTPKGVVGNVK